MAGPFVAQIIFRSSDSGWSETYYPLGASLGAAFTAMDTVCTARMAMALDDVEVQAIRVSDMTVKGDSNLRVPTTSVGTFVDAAAVTFDTDVAILDRFTSADGITRSRHYARGLPSTAVIVGDPFQLKVANAAFIAALALWENAFKANCQMVVKNHDGSFSNKTIFSIDHQVRLVIRRSGRPFGLHPGRRRTA